MLGALERARKELLIWKFQNVAHSVLHDTDGVLLHDLVYDTALQVAVIAVHAWQILLLLEPLVLHFSYALIYLLRDTLLFTLGAAAKVSEIQLVFSILIDHGGSLNRTMQEVHPFREGLRCDAGCLLDIFLFFEGNNMDSGGSVDLGC